MGKNPLVGKHFDCKRLLKDIAAGEIQGIHFHQKGDKDQEQDVIEIVLGKGRDYYPYAYQLYLLDGLITKLVRVKFETLCGGWRGKDHVITKIPTTFGINLDELGDFLGEYFVRTGTPNPPST